MTKSKSAPILKMTVDVKVLKTAFRQCFPDQSAQEVFPLWLKFWKGLQGQVVVEEEVRVAFPLPKDEV